MGLNEIGNLLTGEVGTMALYALLLSPVVFIWACLVRTFAIQPISMWAEGCLMALGALLPMPFLGLVFSFSLSIALSADDTVARLVTSGLALGLLAVLSVSAMAVYKPLRAIANRAIS